MSQSVIVNFGKKPVLENFKDSNRHVAGMREKPGQKVPAVIKKKNPLLDALQIKGKSINT